MDRSILPTGTILPYAGEHPDQLEAEGWLLCDGRAVAVGTYQQLYDAIGGAFGQPSQTEFNVPWFNGVFLRGRQGDASGRSPNGDPDAEVRGGLKYGGNTGNRVGSYQPYATARPHTGFRSSISKGEITEKSVDGGGGEDISQYYSTSKNVVATAGGDLESRPTNKYVYFIIKFEDYTAAGQPVEAPIGSIMAFAGIDPTHMQTNWKLCSGETLSKRGVFKALFDAVGFSNGQLDENQFFLPDYRGCFLRGVQGGGGFDPEADTRGPPQPGQPEGQQGNSGNAVGSVQDQATGLPTTSAFITPYPHLPQGYYNNISKIGGWNVFLWNKTGRSITLSERGGDAETRPVNVSANWYIRFR